MIAHLSHRNLVECWVDMVGSLIQSILILLEQ